MTEKTFTIEQLRKFADGLSDVMDEYWSSDQRLMHSYIDEFIFHMDTPDVETIDAIKKLEEMGYKVTK